ncbi:hypothetical protein BDZ97DRAFT_1913818 [Flammula alnicola]|nr:hypothetical protein BDZ97DRAFT_1913818 [Flammula alnicola]
MAFEGAMPLDWTLVPDIFGSASDVHNLRRRPLRSLTLSLVKGQQKDDHVIIDKDTLSRMLSLVAQGIEIKIELKYRGIDILQQSVEFHAHDSALGESQQGPTHNSSSNLLGEE